MRLILCSAADQDALWLHRSLVASGMDDLELVTQEVLTLALKIEHRLGEDGVGFTVQLADGREIDTREVRGVVNRMTAAMPAHLERAEPKDREYATQEFAALFMSLLEAFADPMLNRPSSQGLSGPWRHPSEWVWLASQAGLATMPYVGESRNAGDPLTDWRPPAPPGASTETAFVVGDQVVGPSSNGLHECCRALARSVGVNLLGVDFVRDSQGSLLFAGATPSPELRRGGEPLAEAIKTELTAQEVEE